MVKSPLRSSSTLLYLQCNKNSRLARLPLLYYILSPQIKSKNCRTISKQDRNEQANDVNAKPKAYICQKSFMSNLFLVKPISP